MGAWIMRGKFMITAALLALLAGPAFAQQTQDTTTTAPSTSGGGVAAQPAPAPDPLTKEDVVQIKGASVYGSDDKKIGHVATILMQPENKTIDRLVVSSGGVLGIGGREVAVPVKEFSWDSQKGAFKLSMTEDQLKSMPEWTA